MVVTTTWKLGPRTPALEVLWRRIFRDVGLVEMEPGGKGPGGTQDRAGAVLLGRLIAAAVDGVGVLLSFLNRIYSPSCERCRLRQLTAQGDAFCALALRAVPQIPVFAGKHFKRYLANCHKTIGELHFAKTSRIKVKR